MSPATAQLEGVRGEIEKFCASLLCPSPQVLNGCSPALARAAEELVALQFNLEACEAPELLDSANRLRREIERATRLLDSAHEYYDGWRRILNSRMGGYTAFGEAVAPARRGTVFLRG